MTPKQRITVALGGGIPDRVPVAPGLSELIPVRILAGDFIEFWWRRRIPLWRARVEVEADLFGADCFLHLAEDPAPEDPPRERVVLADSADEIRFRDIIHTARGDLAGIGCLKKESTFAQLEPMVRDPEGEADKVLELLKHPHTKDLSALRAAYDEIGSRAHAGFWLPTPVEWWDRLRGTQNMIMDLIDLPAVMARIFDAYTEYAEALLDHVLAHAPLDSVGLGGSSTSMSVINPALYRRYTLDFGKRMVATARRHGRLTQYHMCGRSRQALPITAEMGVDGFDALEPPPTGDVDLAEVKRSFPGISLRGNVNSITVMLRGTPADVRRAVQACLAAAKEGGGFILGVGDQAPYDTPDDNLRAFVQAGREFGAYKHNPEIL